MKIALFHHIYAVGDFAKIVDEQLALTEKWHFDFEYFPCVRYEGEEPLYEVSTLHKLWKWAKENPNAVIFYIHTKGVTNPQSVVAKKWRDTLNYWTLYRYRTALRVLIDSDFSAVGCRYFDMRFGNGRLPHFSGNFWLARSNYIATLKDPTIYARAYTPKFGKPPERYGCEFWVCSGKGRFSDIHSAFKINNKNFHQNIFTFSTLVSRFGKDY